jgi:hypothetical protein
MSCPFFASLCVPHLCTSDELIRVQRAHINGRRLKLGEKHPHTLGSMNNLIELYEAWGKPELAEQWRGRQQRE